MAEKYKIAIVGAGPGGLSAAVRAAELGVSHVLLEAALTIASTIHRFPKGKPVMTEPMKLPLRSSLKFSAGTRESVLECWEREVSNHRVNLRVDAKVSGIGGQRGDFELRLATGESIAAETVVLAIGLQSNIRKLAIPGESLPSVQYQLDDPDEYRQETIVVIGGGDTGVENALALAVQNRVILLNRQEEFSTCSEANHDRLKKAVTAGQITTWVSTTPIHIEAQTKGRPPLRLAVQTPQGIEYIECHRIIARLGATPPRKMLESYGIRFPNDDLAAVPQLSEQYESNVPGLYVVGILAGYPLIKQALNQGHEVVEYILGHPTEPADHANLQEKLSRIPGFTTVAEGVRRIRASLPLFDGLTTLQLRELIFESDVHAPTPGEIFFRKNDYGNSFFSIVEGSVQIQIEAESGKPRIIILGRGDFFGEIGLLSGRRRSGTVIAGKGCVVIETPRRTMLKLLDSAPGAQRRLDEVSLKRIIRNCFGAPMEESQVEHLVQETKPKKFATGEVLFCEGDKADGLYMIRRGSVTVSRQIDGKEVVVSYISAGNYVGEMALVSKMPRTATVRAAAPTEVVLLEAERFDAVLNQNPSVRGAVASRYLDDVRSNELSREGKNSQLVRFLLGQGMGEATDVLLIDYTKCIRCNNCEQACADVHGGNSRFSRQAGHTYEQVHVPASCRHCEHPYCMKDCPSDAILRWKNGEVYIGENCIGCGNCGANCPYGVIQMASKAKSKRLTLLQQIFGPNQSAMRDMTEDDSIEKIAVKCDMCMGIIGGAACVRACPTGAAMRASPEEFLSMSVK